MVDKYFVNCRGATFNKVHATEWDKSGGMPRMSSPFSPYREDLDETLMTFAGSTKTSNWLCWDADEANAQLDMLKGVGINLLRVYGDLYCWSSFKDRYMNAVEEFAALCNSKKMYIQWVLFDGYTESDSSSDGHELGYFDPSTPPESIAWGIRRWQRCPGIKENDLSYTEDYYKKWYGMPTRTPDFLSLSGGAQYIKDMAERAGKYKATLAWEVMHDVNILSTEPEGYDFLVNAITVTNGAKTSSQKNTFSAKNINAFDNMVSTGQPADVYNSGLVSVLTPMVDYVCELTSKFSTLGLINSYARLREFSTKTGKPVMLIDSFNESLATPSDLFNFSKDFNIGVICEGMVDRSFSRKPNNATKGLLYDDGESRRSVDASAVVAKAISDGRSSRSVSAPNEKTSFTLLDPNVEASSIERFQPFEEFGSHSWSKIYTASRQFPEYSGIPIGYLPIASSVSSSFQGWGLVGDASSYQSPQLFDTLSSIMNELSDTPLATFVGTDVERDQFGHKILSRLIKLTEDLDMHIGHNYYKDPLYSKGNLGGFIASGYQESVFSSASSFLPQSTSKPEIYNASPFIGTSRYLSSIALDEGAYRDNRNYFQKPLCYWVRPPGYASGCCLYNSETVDVSIMDTSEVDILNVHIDWASYDTEFSNWAFNLYNAYVNLNNNLKDYLDDELGELSVSGYLTTKTYIT